MASSIENEIPWSEISYPQFQILQKRVDSYFERFWPVSLNQSALAMAEAGFHYSGYGDIVTCSYCGLNLYKWQLDDIPLVEHAKFNENCAYVSLLESKTSNTPISTSTSHCQNINCFGKIKLTNISNKLRILWRRLIDCISSNDVFVDVRCKICFNENASVLVLPCNHISTCISCTSCINCCPICRQDIISLMKVYFS